MDYVSKFPGHSPEAYERMQRLKAGPLRADQAEPFLAAYREGYSRARACRLARCSMSSVTLSLAYDPEFRRAYHSIERGRKKQVLAKLVEACLVGSTEVRTTRVPLTNRDGEPLVYDGKTRMRLAKVEKVRRGATAEMFLNCLKMLGLAEEQDKDKMGGRTKTLDELRNQLAEKLKLVG